MKLPSLSYLGNQAKQAFLRFPLTILSALVLVWLGIDLIETGKELPEVLPEFNVLLCAGLGISLYFCANVIATKFESGLKGKIILNSLATLFLVAVYFSLPQINSTYITAQPYIKFAIYVIASHLLVSFVPYLAEKQFNGFWQYNKLLFIRFLAAALYAGFIYVGLIIALTALRLLFDVKIPDKLYAELWVTVAALFTTWFFVAGVPSDLETLNEKREYPKALRVFSQYVLLPLLAVYLLILYAYGAKILLTWDWPRGVVSYLIIFVSVLGSLSFLLLHPYGEHEEQTWIKKANRVYYYLLFPLLFILFIAIFMRLNDYGITINRYVVLMLGIWLTAVCVYTALGKTNIKFIPASLALMLVLISFGPWGLFSVSEGSQVKRLQTLLEREGWLKNGTLQHEVFWIKDSSGIWQIKAEQSNLSLSDSLHNEVYSMLEYLDDYHGFSAIQSWFTQNMDSLVQAREADRYSRFSNLEASMYMQAMGLEFKKKYGQLDIYGNSYVSNSNMDANLVKGYDYLLKFESYLGSGDEQNIANWSLDSLAFEMRYSGTAKASLIFFAQADTVVFDLQSFCTTLEKRFKGNEETIPKEHMTLFANSQGMQIKLQVQNMRFNRHPPFKIDYISGCLFIKLTNSDSLMQAP